MRVLALTSYPEQAAVTRYRLVQFVAPLAEHGIELIVRPFLEPQTFADLYKREAALQNALGLLKAAVRRVRDLIEAVNVDLILIQREAMMFGPPVIEWTMTKVLRRPLVLDLDDATYVRYVSPTYGRIASALKWFSKTDDLIAWSSLVICGNRHIADYVSSKGKSKIIIPTVVDLEKFRPRSRSKRVDDKIVVGWIGTHSTFPYLESIFPVLGELARCYKFRLKVIGSGRAKIEIPGVEVENCEWALEREVEDLQSFDVGLYPIVNDAWAVGKSGFKAIQYMSVGVPYVVSPVGACAEIGEPGVTHLCATTGKQWYDALARLITDEELRRRMGEAGRAHAEKHYALPDQVAKLAHALRWASRQKNSVAREAGEFLSEDET